MAHLVDDESYKTSEAPEVDLAAQGPQHYPIADGLHVSCWADPF